MSAAFRAGAYYAEVLGWLIFPVGQNKKPLTEHGRTDASRDPVVIEAWAKRWPNALIALATGEAAGVVAIDVDLSDAVNGFDSLDALGVSIYPTTATSHTPRGGCHMLFRHPGHHVKTIAGRLGAGLDIRGDGGSITLPPGPGRFWDPHLGSATPLAPFPAWANIPEPARRVPGVRPMPGGGLSKYGETALDGALKRIVGAAAGAQEVTLNAEVYSIGQLAGAGVIPAGIALDALIWGAGKMPSFDSHRPWRLADIERKVKAAFADGLSCPRTVSQ